MDEPFGALDAMTRDLLHDELERLWQHRTFTVVFVTHNVREAARLGDRIVLLTSRPGRVAQELHINASIAARKGRRRSCIFTAPVPTLRHALAQQYLTLAAHLTLDLDQRP